MAQLNLFIDELLKKEGGKVDHPADPGGATNLGITIKTWTAYGKDMNGDGKINKADLWLITKRQATPIYQAMYWDAMGLTAVKSQSVAEIIMDHGVNAGNSRAVKMLQQILNTEFGYKLAVDGKNGPMTTNALNAVDAKTFFNFYKRLREEFYAYRAASLPANNPIIPFLRAQLNIGPSQSAKVFLKGWLNRVNSFKFKA